MYTDQVFCFTPKGDADQAAERGATPIDFAYAVHTKVGHGPAGSAPRWTGLRVRSGPGLKKRQSVDIVTCPRAQTPQSTWIEIARDRPRSKAAIRRRLREEDRERFIKLGANWHASPSRTWQEGDRQGAQGPPARALALEDTRRTARAARLGRADQPRKVVRRDLPSATRRCRPRRGDRGGPRRRGPVLGQPFSPARRLLSAASRGNGSSASPRGAAASSSMPSTASSSPATRTTWTRWVDLHWQEGTHPARNAVTLDLAITTDAGVLGADLTLIASKSANISHLQFIDRKPDYYRLLMDVDLRDVEHLHRVMTRAGGRHQRRLHRASPGPRPPRVTTGETGEPRSHRSGPAVRERRDRRGLQTQGQAARSGKSSFGPLWPKGGWGRAAQYVRQTGLPALARPRPERDLPAGSGPGVFVTLHALLRAALS